jgi:hypothetical protein
VSSWISRKSVKWRSLVKSERCEIEKAGRMPQMLSAELDSEQGYQEEAKQWAGTSCTRSQARRQMYYVISVFPHSRYSHALWFRVRGQTFRMGNPHEICQLDATRMFSCWQNCTCIAGAPSLRPERFLGPRCPK